MSGKGVLKGFFPVISLSFSVLTAAIASVCLASAAQAAITWSGDLYPLNPASRYGSIIIVGQSSTGDLAIDGGSQLGTNNSILGLSATATGTVTVTGVGSTWDNRTLVVGDNGIGTLNINSGGKVSSLYGYLGDETGSTGSAVIVGAGSMWTISNTLYVGNHGSGTLTVTDGGTVTVNGLFASFSHLFGNGTITTNGAVLDADLHFDSTHSLQQTLAFGTGGSLNMNQKSTSVLGVGYHDAGTLTIAEGVVVSSSSGNLGYHPGSNGTATVTGSGSKWNCSGMIEVGYQGSATLNIDAGAQVSCTYGYLGAMNGSTGTAIVNGAGSKWSLNGDLYVGREGNNGYLTVSNGGEVAVLHGLYASLNDISGNGVISANGAVLDADLRFDTAHGFQQTLSFGTGGTLTVNQMKGENLGVGYKDSGTLLIADGMAVESSYGYLGYYAGSTGTATVTGAGSKWTMSNPLDIGRDGNGSLRIEAGGQVSNSYGYLAYAVGSSGAVTVTGAGSLWTNSNTLYIGEGGNGTLTVESGGQVTSNGGYLGSMDGSAGAVTITGAGSKWTNSGDLYIGNTGNGSLTVANGGEVTAKTLFASRSDLSGDGVISASGAVIDADMVFDSTHGNQKTFSFGTGGTINLNLNAAGCLGVGNKGDGTLSISEGVVVASTTGYLGYTDGSTGTAIVTGPGSKWTNSGTFYVGYHGNGNLRIEAGAEVSISYGYIGVYSNSSSTSSVVITGAGSKWTNSGALSITNSSLRIEAGGQVSDTDCSISSGTNFLSTATITGANSLWTNTRTLTIGSSGNGTLLIEAGGQANCVNAYLGYYPNAKGSATVTGAGSKWTISDNLYVGNTGSGTLTVSESGLVTAKTLYASVGNLLGNGTITAQGAVLDADLVFDNGSSQQKILPFGSGGTLSVNLDANSLFGAGYKNSGTLRVANSVSVTSRYGYLGYLDGSNGSATITGSGSKWTNNTIYVGHYGSGSVRVEAGAQVTSWCTLGNYPNSSGSVTVTGAGSKWLSSGNYFVGYSGNGTLNVEAGGQVASGSGYLGYNAASTGVATITGANSLWSSDSSFYVGYSGRGTLLIEAGAQAIGNYGYMGFQTGAFGKTTVTGAGSKWTMQQDLFVGGFGDGELRIETGAQVSNVYGYVGCGFLGQGQGEVDSNSTGTVIVTGAGSTWTNSAILFVGNSANGILRIEAGGQVNSVSGSVGNSMYGSHSSSTVTVSGTGSKWTMTGGLDVGVYMNSTLRIENGGEVKNLNSSLGDTVGYSGNVTVTGAGSKWTNSNLYVGNYGNGSLNIEDGGQVTDTIGYLGNNSGSVAVVTVTGAGSQLIGDLNVGFAGNGTLNINSGGLVVARTFKLAANPGSTGVCNLNGGTLKAGNFSRGIGAVTFNWIDGTIQNLPPPYPASLLIANNVTLNLAATGTHSFNIDLNRTGTVGGILADATTGGSLKKIGSGSLVVAAANTYSGETVIEAGHFKVTGSILNTSSVTVGSLGILELAKTAGSATAPSLAIGNDGTVLISAGSQTVGRITGVGITQVTGSASLSAQSIVQNTLSVGGTGAASAMSTVPEPSTLAILLTATLGSLLLWRWRR